MNMVTTQFNFLKSTTAITTHIKVIDEYNFINRYVHIANRIIMKYCVYLTIYRGSKLPPFYIGSTSVLKIDNGYHGSVSSKKYKHIYQNELKNNPDSFKTVIISKFKSRAEALIKERILQIYLNVVKSPMYFNMSIASPNGFAGMDVKGENNPNYGSKMSIESKEILSKCRKGMAIVYIPELDKTMTVSINDLRYLSGEIHGVRKGCKTKLADYSTGKIVAKDSMGNIIHIECSDPRYLSGELVHHTKGMKTVYIKITNEKIRINMNDFDPSIHSNLKMKIIHVKDKDGNSLMVLKDDPKFISGEYVIFSKGRVTVKDKSGNISRVI